MNIVNPNYYDKDTTVTNLGFMLYRLEKQDSFGTSSKTEISILEEKANKAWSVKSTNARLSTKEVENSLKTYELLQGVSKKLSKSKAVVLKELLENELKRIETEEQT